MKTIVNPPRSEWVKYTQRETLKDQALSEKVAQIILNVRERGDAALAEYAQRFDGGVPETWRLSLAERDSQAAKVPDALRAAIDQAIANITCFHSTQCAAEQSAETMPGVTCYRRAVPFKRAGLYVPAGTAPLFSSLLMLAIPAKLAGVEEIVVCTPGGSSRLIDPAIALCAQRLGITEMYRIGGAQAIAALAFGTLSVQAVEIIGGPGNQYVTEAKIQVAQERVAIDMPAGPSEVLVLADGGANPRFVAADLLAQAEHGVDSSVVLVTDDASLVAEVEREVLQQLEALPRRAIAQAVMDRAYAVIFDDCSVGLEFSDYYAPEHLILSVRNPEYLAERVRNAGSVFLGDWAAEAVGDYASGTNHVLPTSGWVRSRSGVSVDTFVRKVTFQKLTRAGLRAIGPIVVEMARAEGLEAHAQAVALRMREEVA
jgi:histidinol dehydrogenase